MKTKIHIKFLLFITVVVSLYAFRIPTRNVKQARAPRIVKILSKFTR